MLNWPRTARRRRVSSSRAINHTARWYTWLCLNFDCLRFCFVFVVLILSHSLNHTPIHLPLRYLSHYTHHPDHTHTIIKRWECGQDGRRFIRRQGEMFLYRRGVCFIWGWGLSSFSLSPIYAPISAIFCYFVHLWAYTCQLNRLSASLHTCSYQAPRPYYHIIWLHGFGVG